MAAWMKKRETAEIIEKVISTPNNNSPEVSPARKTFLQELKLWSKINPDSSYIHLLLRPWSLIIYPAVFFGFLAISTTLAWVVCYVDTATSVYQSPPHLMNIGISGLYLSLGFSLGLASGVDLQIL